MEIFHTSGLIERTQFTDLLEHTCKPSRAVKIYTLPTSIVAFSLVIGPYDTDSLSAKAAFMVAKILIPNISEGSVLLPWPELNTYSIAVLLP